MDKIMEIPKIVLDSIKREYSYMKDPVYVDHDKQLVKLRDLAIRAINEYKQYKAENEERTKEAEIFRKFIEEIEKDNG